MNFLNLGGSFVLALGASAALSIPTLAQTQPCSSWSSPETIYAGQTIEVGTWSISNDDQNLYVDVQLNTTVPDCSGAAERTGRPARSNP